VTSKALRCIDKKGSLDNYLLYSKPQEIDSKTGLELRALLESAYADKYGKPFNHKEGREELLDFGVIAAKRQFLKNMKERYQGGNVDAQDKVSEEIEGEMKNEVGEGKEGEDVVANQQEEEGTQQIDAKEGEEKGKGEVERKEETRG